MANTIRLKVDESLKQVLERIRVEVASDMKRQYNLNEVVVHGTLASQILAAKMRGERSLRFKIEKCSLNKGFLKLL